MIREADDLSNLVDTRSDVADAMRRMRDQRRPLWRLTGSEAFRVEFQVLDDEWRAPQELVELMVEAGLLVVSNAYKTRDAENLAWVEVWTRAALTKEGLRLADRLPNPRLQEGNAT